MAATPAFGSPLPLPPRHLPNRSSPSPDRPAERERRSRCHGSRLPAREAAVNPSRPPPQGASHQTPPPQRFRRNGCRRRLPGQNKTQTDATPTPPRPAARQEPGTRIFSSIGADHAPSASHTASRRPRASHLQHQAADQPVDRRQAVVRRQRSCAVVQPNVVRWSNDAGGHTRQRSPRPKSRVYRADRAEPLKARERRAEPYLGTNRDSRAGIERRTRAPVGRVSTNEAPGNPKRIVAGKRFTIERRPRAKSGWRAKSRSETKKRRRSTGNRSPQRSGRLSAA